MTTTPSNQHLSSSVSGKIFRYCAAVTSPLVDKCVIREFNSRFDIVDAPYRANFSQTLCRWVKGESNQCAIEFQSNPQAQRVVLEKDGLQLNNFLFSVVRP